MFPLWVGLVLEEELPRLLVKLENQAGRFSRHKYFFLICYLYSRATSHICVCMQDLKTSKPLKKREVVLKVGNGAIVDPLAIKTSFTLLYTEHAIKLKDCLYVPDAIQNVVSIRRLVNENYEFSFANNMCYIYYCNEYVGMGALVNGFYILELQESMRERNVNVTTTSSEKSSRDDGVDPRQL